MSIEEGGLDVVGFVVVGAGAGGGGLEVGDGIAAAEALGGDVVSLGGLVLLVEGAEPDALVLLVNLGAPAAVGLGDDALVFGGGELAGLSFDAAADAAAADFGVENDAAGSAAEAAEAVGVG
ncbi:unnamed protein product [Prunus armeniaca]|uniref:Uncharacterized protein n=1 Tax=Prunus armeniaca TaxID=36596 RepID=A0A6J5TLN3_PRUAR|nr:unnamed protein product [Prunus armeniaca]